MTYRVGSRMVFERVRNCEDAIVAPPWPDGPVGTVYQMADTGTCWRLVEKPERIPEPRKLTFGEACKLAVERPGKWVASRDEGEYYLQYRPEKISFGTKGSDGVVVPGSMCHINSDDILAEWTEIIANPEPSPVDVSDAERLAKAAIRLVEHTIHQQPCSCTSCEVSNMAREILSRLSNGDER